MLPPTTNGKQKPVVIPPRESHLLRLESIVVLVVNIFYSLLLCFCNICTALPIDITLIVSFVIVKTQTRERFSTQTSVCGWQSFILSVI